MLRKAFIPLLALCALFPLMLAAWLVVVHPDNLLVRMVRAPISHQIGNGKVITGPFPLERDFDILRSEGVTTVISLLNPDIYYEGVLLKQEQEMASRFGMKLLVFPMSSILGQRFGADYQANAQAAADAAAKAPGKVYLHCYLGLHRSRVVLDALNDMHVNVGVSDYSVRKGERSKVDIQTDKADAAFRDGEYGRVLEIIPDQQGLTSDQVYLRAWSLYRMGRFSEAYQSFKLILQNKPEDVDALLGSGYSRMQLNDLPAAEQDFMRATQLSPQSSDVWTGLGLTHLRLDRLAQARMELQRALKMNPANKEAVDALANLKDQP